MLTEITATEESRFMSLNQQSDLVKVAKRETVPVGRKDSSSANGVRKPCFRKRCKSTALHSLLQFDVGLLRMTNFNTWSVP
jgi:hypothetical protein